MKEIHRVMEWMQGLEAFRSVDPTMPLQLAHTFLVVATHEGISATEISESTGFKLATISRHVLDLGRRNRMKGPGYGLVEPRVDESDLRRKLIYLTQRGRKIFDQISQIMLQRKT